MIQVHESAGPAKMLAIAACAGLLALLGCASEGGDSRGDGSEDDALANAIDCLQGTWNEDMANLLAQWQSGSPSVAALPMTGIDGRNTLRVTEKSMVYSLDQRAQLTMPSGPGFTGEAITSGSATFDYRAESPTAMTVGPVTAQGVTSITRVYIAGRLSSETPVAWDGGLQGDAIWWCEGDSLSLEPSASGWIHLFTRAN